ncbi:hypothetical protein QBC36DRAFT_321184 [Triangularia setosa]|uniref:Uncharacterized protein n=1 Tax=Triangularia setosa TaxID=2587417 RepID=A0AAN6WDG1_9PEZI|nr:hypothetical protein QBC36DRAFT_321184 [Podospora setosa]
MHSFCHGFHHLPLFFSVLWSGGALRLFFVFFLPDIKLGLRNFVLQPFGEVKSIIEAMEAGLFGRDVTTGKLGWLMDGRC